MIMTPLRLSTNDHKHHADPTKLLLQFPGSVSRAFGVAKGQQLDGSGDHCKYINMLDRSSHLLQESDIDGSDNGSSPGGWPSTVHSINSTVVTIAHDTVGLPSKPDAWSATSTKTKFEQLDRGVSRRPWPGEMVYWWPQCGGRGAILSTEHGAATSKYRSSEHGSTQPIDCMYTW